MGSLTQYKISFICFLDLFAASLIVSLMNNYLRGEIHLSNFFIGIISSIFSLLQIISAPAVGYLSDLYGRKIILLTCLLVCVLCYFLLGMFMNVFVIVLVRILLGVFKHTQVLCKAYISDVCTDTTTAYSQLMMVTFLGFFIGPALGGHMITYEDGFMYICCLASSVFLLTFVYAYFVIHDVERKLSTGEKEGLEDTGGSLQGHDVEKKLPTGKREGLEDTGDSLQGHDVEKKLPTGERDGLEDTGDSLQGHDVEGKLPTGERDGLEDTGDSLQGEEFIDAQFKSSSNRPSDAALNQPEGTQGGKFFSKSNLISYCKETLNIDWSRYWGIFLIKFLYALSMSLFYSNYISVLTHNFESSSQVTGYTVSFQGLIGSCSNFFINIGQKHSYVSLYYSFVLLSASILSLYMCVNLYLFVILLIPLSISSSLIRVLCLNITMSSSETNRSGNISGIYNSLTSIAKVITPILGGLVSDWVQDNYKVTFLVSFVFALLGVVFSRIVMSCSVQEDREKRD